MIIHIIRLKVAPHDRKNAIRTIQAAIGPTKFRQGCLTCAFYCHIDNDDELFLMQKWDSQQALDSYVQSSEYNLLVEGMELAVEEPVIEFHSISASTGLEYVKQTRQEMSA